MRLPWALWFGLGRVVQVADKKSNILLVGQITELLLHCVPIIVIIYLNSRETE